MELTKESKELFEKISKLTDMPEKSNLSEMKSPPAPKKAPVQYDPRKKYTWEPTDQFVLSGEEFATIINTFRAILSSAEAQRILTVERAHYIAESAIARGLELGFVKEKVDDVPKQNMEVLKK